MAPSSNGILSLFPYKQINNLFKDLGVRLVPPWPVIAFPYHKVLNYIWIIISQVPRIRTQWSFMLHNSARHWHFLSAFEKVFGCMQVWNNRPQFLFGSKISPKAYFLKMGLQFVTTEKWWKLSGWWPSCRFVLLGTDCQVPLWNPWFLRHYFFLPSGNISGFECKLPCHNVLLHHTSQSQAAYWWWIQTSKFTLFSWLSQASVTTTRMQWTCYWKKEHQRPCEPMYFL